MSKYYKMVDACNFMVSIITTINKMLLTSQIKL